MSLCPSTCKVVFLSCVIVLGLFFLPVDIYGNHVRLEVVEGKALQGILLVAAGLPMAKEVG